MFDAIQCRTYTAGKNSQNNCGFVWDRIGMIITGPSRYGTDVKTCFLKEWNRGE